MQAIVGQFRPMMKPETNLSLWSRKIFDFMAKWVYKDIQMYIQDKTNRF